MHRSISSKPSPILLPLQYSFKNSVASLQNVEVLRHFKATFILVLQEAQSLNREASHIPENFYKMEPLRVAR